MRKLITLILPLFLFVSMACSLPILVQEAESPTDTPQPGFEGSMEPSIMPSLTVTAGAAEPIDPSGIDFSISEKQISEDVPSPKYILQVNYPFLEGAPRAALFNQRIEDFIQSEMNSFKANAEENEAWRLENLPGVGSDLRITYEVTYQQSNILSILFSIGFYAAGAAHPGLYMHSFNYDVALGQFFELPELFKPGSSFLEIISAYCIDELTETGMMAWEDGAQPFLSNYRNWNIQDDGVLISFDPYEVAPGAAGLLQVVVPYEMLQDEILPHGLLAPLLD